MYVYYQRSTKGFWFCFSVHCFAHIVPSYCNSIDRILRLWLKLSFMYNLLKVLTSLLWFKIPWMLILDLGIEIWKINSSDSKGLRLFSIGAFDSTAKCSSAMNALCCCRISHMAKKIKQQIKQSTIWEHQSNANHEIDWKGITILDQETVDIKRKLKLRPSLSDASIQPSIEMGVKNFLRFSIISRHVTNSYDCAIQLKATILKNRRPLNTTTYFSNNCNSLFH